MRCKYLYLSAKAGILQSVKVLPFKRISFRSIPFSLSHFSQGDNGPEPPAANLDISIQDIECVFHSLKWASFAKDGIYSSNFKTLTGRQYSFEMLTQFKVLNKVLDPLSCNLSGSLQDIE
jgi:hypothetical protein